MYIKLYINQFVGVKFNFRKSIKMKITTQQIGWHRVRTDYQQIKQVLLLGAILHSLVNGTAATFKY